MHSFQVYFINLDSRSDKRKNIEKQLKQEGFLGTRIPGVRPIKNDNRKNYVTEQVEGCWLAHQSVYKTGISNQNKYFLALEDDALIKKHSLLKFKKLEFDFVNLKIDILQVGFVEISKTRHILRILSDCLWKTEVNVLAIMMHLPLRSLHNFLSQKIRVQRAIKTQEISKKMGLGYLRPDDFRPGTHAYLISKDFAAILQDANKPTFFSADQFLMALSKMCTFEIWRTTKNFCKQELKFESDIEGKRFMKYS